MTGIPVHYKLDKASGDIIYDDRRLKTELKKRVDQEYTDEALSDLDEKFDDTFFNHRFGCRQPECIYCVIIC